MVEPLHVRARAARKAQGKTQQQVAEASGVSLGTYQMFETGRSMPQGANLQAILGTLDLTAEAEDSAIAELTRESLPLDIRLFFDALTVWLLSMDEETRFQRIQDEMRRIIANR